MLGLIGKYFVIAGFRFAGLGYTVLRVLIVGVPMSDWEVVKRLWVVGFMVLISLLILQLFDQGVVLVDVVLILRLAGDEVMVVRFFFLFLIFHLLDQGVVLVDVVLILRLAGDEVKIVLLFLSLEYAINFVLIFGFLIYLIVIILSRIRFILIFIFLYWWLFYFLKFLLLFKYIYCIFWFIFFNFFD